MDGWIKLHRKIQVHWLFEEKRKFSKFEAWIDLLMMVNHEDKKVVIGNETIEVKRGQRLTSIRQLCDRWGWSNTKVTQYLKSLYNEGMIEYKSDAKKTLITIVNYGFYQGDGDEKTTKNSQKNDEEQTQKHTNKNEKNLINNTPTPPTDAHAKENPIEVYEQEIGRFTDTIRDKMIDWLDGGYFDEPEAIMIAAIQEAAIYEKRSWAYLERILQECLNKNIRTVEQFRQKKAEAAAEKEKKLVRLRKEETDEKHKGPSQQPKYDYGF
ncbi:DnaD domain protein [Aneurinibacillus thermoaerophilus]|uniref:DnaD domain-containing protein n=1 Tax=Aneurinibacillus thermoaerophilus TaxID=143495 RepID=UPI002E1C87EB|nr:DnaD domain protein [Aneurinibacillus thermoaerophilus]MED0761072.1 DnaD domain protein [Aneurinibacillus thermoaerophilus]